MTILKSAALAAVLVVLCSAVHAYTLTFDDVPAGQSWDTYYFDHYGILFDFLGVSDHSGSSWGPPHSGSSVLSGSDDGATIKRCVNCRVKRAVVSFL